MTLFTIIGLAMALAGPPSVAGYILMDVVEYSCGEEGPIVEMRSYAHPNGRWIQRRWLLAGREFIVQYAQKSAAGTIRRVWVSEFGTGVWKLRKGQVSSCEVAASVGRVRVL